MQGVVLAQVGDTPAIGRPAEKTDAGLIAEYPRVSSIGVHHLDVAGGNVERVGLIRLALHEGELGPIGRPDGTFVVAVVGDTLWFASVRADGVEMGVPFAVVVGVDDQRSVR